MTRCTSTLAALALVLGYSGRLAVAQQIAPVGPINPVGPIRPVGPMTPIYPGPQPGPFYASPVAPEFKVVFSYNRDNPRGTFRYQVFDVRQRQYTTAQDA